MPHRRRVFVASAAPPAGSAGADAFRASPAALAERHLLFENLPVDTAENEPLNVSREATRRNITATVMLQEMVYGFFFPKRYLSG